MLRSLAMRMFLTVFLALPSLVPSARADENYSIGLGRPQALKDHGFSSIAAPGVALGGEYIHQFSSPFGIGVQADLMNFKKKASDIDGVLTEGQTKATAFAAVLKFSPLYDGAFSPYLLGGAGLHLFSVKLDAQPKTGFVWADTGTAEKRSYTRNDMGFLYMLGFGAERVWEKGYTAGLDFRWHVFQVSKSKFGATEAKAFTIMLRGGIRFPS
jgi:hypothetical protein